MDEFFIKQLIAKKQKLGYSPTVENVIVGRNVPSIGENALNNLGQHVNINKHTWFFISFEANGIAIIGFEYAEAKFNNLNLFIANEDVTKFMFKPIYFRMLTVLAVESKGSKFRFDIHPKMMPLPKYQDENLQKIYDMIDQND